MVQRIVLADDLEAASGVSHPAEADTTVTIGIDGEWRELDLTDEHEKQLADDLRQYWNAARPVADARVKVMRQEKRSALNIEGREFWKGFRAWCDERSRIYNTEGGKFSPAREDQREYVAFARAQGLIVPDRYDI